jgi:uncharacterized protein YjbI with pentapeptide repeats
VDIQAALRVLGQQPGLRKEEEARAKRLGQWHSYQIDLRGANLQGLDISYLDLRRALLTGTRLEGAHLTKVDLRRAWMFNVHFECAFFVECDLRGAWLTDASLEGARLYTCLLECFYSNGIVLKQAHLLDCDLTFAGLLRAKCQKISISHSKFDNALVVGADFRSPSYLDSGVLESSIGDETTKTSSEMERPAGWTKGEMAGADRRRWSGLRKERLKEIGLDFEP